MLHYKVLKWLSSHPAAPHCIVALVLCIICLPSWLQLWNWTHAPLQSAKTVIIPSYSTTIDCSISSCIICLPGLSSLPSASQFILAMPLCIFCPPSWLQLWNWKHAPLQRAKTVIILSNSTTIHCSIGIMHYLSAIMMPVVKLVTCSPKKC